MSSALPTRVVAALLCAAVHASGLAWEPPLLHRGTLGAPHDDEKGPMTAPRISMPRRAAASAVPDDLLANPLRLGLFTKEATVWMTQGQQNQPVYEIRGSVPSIMKPDVKHRVSSFLSRHGAALLWGILATASVLVIGIAMRGVCCLWPRTEEAESDTTTAAPQQVEVVPEVPTEAAAGSEAAKTAYSHTAKTVLFGAMYICFSSALINYNKFLMHKDRFPYAVSLTSLHSACASVFAICLFAVRPTLFPALSGKDVEIISIARKVTPIAVFFTGTLLLSNLGFLYCTVAFIQFIKEFNVVLVYLFSLAASLESPSWQRGKIIACIMLATLGCVQGELAFSAVGLGILLFSGLMEAARVTMQAMLLKGPGKLDPLSYVLFVMPQCFLMLMLVLCLSMASGSQFIKIAAISDFARWWHHLLPNCMIAIMLNVSIALFVENSGAIAYMLVGIVKDCCIILADVVCLGDIVSTIQVVSYTCQIALIICFSLAKMFPERFEGGIFGGLCWVFQDKVLGKPADTVAIKQASA